MAPNEDGYAVEEGALLGVQRDLRQGRSTLDGIGKPPSVDAGASSGAVSKVMQQLVALGVAHAQQLEEAANNVNAAKGSYEQIENDHAGLMRYQQEGLPENGYLDSRESRPTRPTDWKGGS